MASSKVMATNQDMPRQPSLCPTLSTLLTDLQNQQNQIQTQTQGIISSDPSHLSMDDLLKNIYSAPHAPFSSALEARAEEGDNKTVDEVWKEIVSGGDQRRTADGAEGMTLEDFLTKAGAVREEDVRGVGVHVGAGVGGGYGVQTNTNNNNNNNNGNGMMMEGGRVRGKRRAIEETPLDKATQQKQRRMIKNRESAARSRERKQAYTVELESLVTQLEEENARLLSEEAEQNKERFQQLMKNLIPVVDKRRPRRVLRRVHSVQW